MSRHGLRPGKILWEVQEAYQPGVVGEKLTRGPLEYAAIWQVAQRMTDRPVKFGAICAPSMAGMLWNAFYKDDKEMMLDLCDIMNAELRDMADAGCPLIQVEEPPHHMRAQQKECTDADLEFLTAAFNRQLKGVNAEIWVHTCWGNPNQQRVHYNVPSYERALPHLLQLNGDVLTIECASSRSEEHTSELQSLTNLVCRLLLEKKNTQKINEAPGHSRRGKSTVSDEHSNPLGRHVVCLAQTRDVQCGGVLDP